MHVPSTRTCVSVSVFELHCLNIRPRHGKITKNKFKKEEDPMSSCLLLAYDSVHTTEYSVSSLVSHAARISPSVSTQSHEQ